MMIISMNSQSFSAEQSIHAKIAGSNAIEDEKWFYITTKF